MREDDMINECSSLRILLWSRKKGERILALQLQRVRASHLHLPSSHKHVSLARHVENSKNHAAHSDRHCRNKTGPLENLLVQKLS